MCLYSKVLSLLDRGSLKGLSDGRRPDSASSEIELLEVKFGPENYFILQKSFNKSKALLGASSVLLSPRSMRSMRSIRLVMTRLDPRDEQHACNCLCPQGKTTSHNVRSCDPVRSRALFPHVQLQVPQQAMRPHRRQHMVVPAGYWRTS